MQPRDWKTIASIYDIGVCFIPLLIILVSSRISFTKLLPCIILFADIWRVDAELKKYTRQVDDVEQRVGDLEKLVKELDEWCSELGEFPCRISKFKSIFVSMLSCMNTTEVKAKRLSAPRR